LIVADGMGGHSSGEVASSIAVKIVAEHLHRIIGEKKPSVIGEIDRKYSLKTNYMVHAIKLANQSIIEASRRYPKDYGMGTTIAACLIDKHSVSIAHVGDSRVYLCRDGNLQQLTTDHSLVEEQARKGLISKKQAEESHLKNILTRALGVDEKVEVDVDEILIQDGDYLLLCSDGLSRMVKNEEMRESIIKNEEPRKICEDLIIKANNAGGKDNITVIVAKLIHDESFVQRIMSDFIKFFTGKKQKNILLKPPLQEQ